MFVRFGNMRLVPLELIDTPLESIRADLELEPLKEDLLANGIRSPILAELTPDGRYLLLGGRRRFEAFKALGWFCIPTMVKLDN